MVPLVDQPIPCSGHSAQLLDCSHFSVLRERDESSKLVQIYSKMRAKSGSNYNLWSPGMVRQLFGAYSVSKYAAAGWTWRMGWLRADHKGVHPSRKYQTHTENGKDNPSNGEDEWPHRHEAGQPIRRAELDHTATEIRHPDHEEEPSRVQRTNGGAETNPWKEQARRRRMKAGLLVWWNYKFENKN